LFGLLVWDGACAYIVAGHRARSIDPSHLRMVYAGPVGLALLQPRGVGVVGNATLPEALRFLTAFTPVQFISYELWNAPLVGEVAG
jgi:hypothetical protein